MILSAVSDADGCSVLYLTSLLDSIYSVAHVADRQGLNEKLSMKNLHEMQLAAGSQGAGYSSYFISFTPTKHENISN